MNDRALFEGARLHPIAWNVHHLRIFQAVAHALSFTAAARDLSIAQPAVSHQVQALERELGVILFERRGRKVALTDVGEALLLTADDVLHRLADGERALAEIGEGLRGSLNVAADTTSGIYVVPAALGAFRRAHPAIDVSLRVENRQGVIRRLTERACDLAVMADPPREIGCDVAPFLIDELLVIADPQHPLAGRSSVPVEALSAERLLIREPGSGTRAAVERFFARTGLPLPATMEVGSTGAIKRAVAAGLGVAVVSRWSIELELQVGRLVVVYVAGFPIERQWSVVNLRDRRLSKAAVIAQSFLIDFAERSSGASAA